MPVELKAALMALAIAAGPVAIRVLAGAAISSSAGPVANPAMVEIPPGTFAYRAAGDFSRAGRPANAPLVPFRLEHKLAVMRHQVTVAEYGNCVAGGACVKLAAGVDRAPSLPVVGVSWNDATAYASWLSAMTGRAYRLPSDEEWAYVAGSRFKDDAQPGIDDSNNPAKLWLAKYDAESARRDRFDSRTRPVGAFGANERDVLDLAGNVWEWTNTCFARQSLDGADRPAASLTVNCGVRVVEGPHRTFVPDFIRDARAGGCSVGEPPSNLGFRLVDEHAAAGTAGSRLATGYK